MGQHWVQEPSDDKGIEQVRVDSSALGNGTAHDGACRGRNGPLEEEAPGGGEVHVEQSELRVADKAVATFPKRQRIPTAHSIVAWAPDNHVNNQQDNDWLLIQRVSKRSPSRRAARQGALHDVTELVGHRSKLEQRWWSSMQKGN